jgi:ABC-type branched-subunit amino acid transport system permease subunit
MDGSSDTNAKNGALAGMTGHISREPETLPYRWGYFQGAVLIPWSLLLISIPAWDLMQPNHYPWYLMAIALSMGLVGLPLAYGLLRRKVFALALVYAMFGLVFLLAVVRLPTVIRQYAFSSQRVSGAFDAGLLLMWLLSVVYYRRRKAEFH